MKIAFASEDGTDIDQHFGLAGNFVVYEIDQYKHRFIKDVELSEAGEESDDKIAARIEALADCSIMYCTHVGGVAAARLVKSKIHPVKVPKGYPIKEILNQLKDRLGNNPPMWLKRALTTENNNRGERS